MILTIDGGTTNTRLYLMDEGEILALRKLSLGIRDTLCPKGKDKYIHAVSDSIGRLTADAPMKPVEAVVCSGMIGSENGLHTCPHIAAPVSFHELAEAMIPVLLPNIASYPFWFVPGVKTLSSLRESALQFPLDMLAEMDVMRGEETEIIGICSKLGICGEHTFLLPGSHMKTIRLDRDGRIENFHTSLTGELLNAAAEHTILKASVGRTYPEIVDQSWLRRGYAFARKYGISRALFKVRILDITVGDMTENELFSFMLGILLCDDVRHLIQEDRPVSIGGSEPFRSSLRCLLTDSDVPVEDIPNEIAECASAYGAWFLWKYRMS